jgi:hypothetical protein
MKLFKKPNEKDVKFFGAGQAFVMENMGRLMGIVMILLLISAVIIVSIIHKIGVKAEEMTIKCDEYNQLKHDTNHYEASMERQCNSNDGDDNDLLTGVLIGSVLSR